MIFLYFQLPAQIANSWEVLKQFLKKSFHIDT
jgi:hypothetical protein